METVLEKKIWTEQELLAIEHPGHKCELVNGEIVMSPVLYFHDLICAAMIRFLGNYVFKRKLGYVAGSNAGFWMANGNLRCPDVSFISKVRAKTNPKFPNAFFQGAPDLVVEVLSPNDTFESLHEKLVEYFESGCLLTWVVNPRDETVHVYRSPQPSRMLRRGDMIDGEDVLEGFSLAVAALFDELDL
jgi:Uma2 family endonuclease